MRGFPCHGLQCFMVLLFFSLVFIQGCARSILQTYPAGEQEIEAVLEAFSRYHKISAEVCPCCLDAEADASLSVSGWFSDHTGKLSGYLQAMNPGYVKFIAPNPLGQPLFIFVTDGEIFISLNVFEEKAYLGSVHSKAFKKFAPPGFEPQFSYYWLTGRLQPGDIRIQAVMRDREQEKFWLQIRHAETNTESMVLFDPAELLILRHVLRDEQGEHLVDILYTDHQPLPGKTGKNAGNASAVMQASDAIKVQCAVPTKVTASANGDTEKIAVRLYSFLDDARFSEEDFTLKIPDNFEQLFVK
ncbi:MAG: hypothetical protein P8Y08_08310 [Desulfobulbaceae bacterium]